MAVFTEVPFEQASALIERLDLGALVDLRGIAAGIENSNFFITCEREPRERREFVLTVFERLDFAQLPFYLQLMKHLAQRGIPVPEPQCDAAGTMLFTLCGKPAAVLRKLAGEHVMAPDAHHCEQVGAMLARLHLAGRDFALQQPNLRGLDWWRNTVPQVLPFLDDDQRRLIEGELGFQIGLAESKAHAALPRGPIHADLFRDNAMFDGDALSGLLDFFFAAVDVLLFDIAVCLNDWCVDPASGRLHEARAGALVQAYGAVRPLEAGERRLLAAMRRAGALRFWLSRLADLHLPRQARLLEAHDPRHFERVLRECIANPWHGQRD